MVQKVPDVICSFRFRVPGRASLMRFVPTRSVLAQGGPPSEIRISPVDAFMNQGIPRNQKHPSELKSGSTVESRLFDWSDVVYVAHIYIYIYITEHAVRYTCVIHHHVCRYYTHVYIYIQKYIYICMYIHTFSLAY